MKCTSCGAHIEETDKRCPYCNTVNEHYKKPEPPAPPTPSVQQAAPTPPPQPQIIKEVVYIKEPQPKEPPKKKSKAKIILSGILTYFFIMAIIYLAYKCNN